LKGSMLDLGNRRKAFRIWSGVAKFYLTSLGVTE
jgi:hypothetical protein